MQKPFFLLLFLLPAICFGQNDTVVKTGKGKTAARHTDESSELKVFYSQRLINANTVEVLPKGTMEFRVSHGFGDIGGSQGGLKPSFFGLDNAADIRIGFQTGITNRFNIITARTRGSQFNTSFLDYLTQLWELGFKYQIMRQGSDDHASPLSLTVFVNTVVSSASSNADPPNLVDTTAASFKKFSDRTSEVVQVMVARKFGKISLQLSPTYVYRGLVRKNYYLKDIDDKGIFALGGAARLPITKNLFFIIDYFHVFRSQATTDSLKLNIPGRNLHFYDPLGLGFEILTNGHVFHLNFTNATELLENRFIPRTVTSWGRGEFRWSFTISRMFRIFHDKKNK